MRLLAFTKQRENAYDFITVLNNVKTCVILLCETIVNLSKNGVRFILRRRQAAKTIFDQLLKGVLLKAEDRQQLASNARLRENSNASGTSLENRCHAIEW
jgi:hypothetical protein